MIHSIGRLCSALFLGICCSFSNAQEVVDQTGNLIDNSQWTGVGAYAPNPNDCCSNPAGSQPLYDTTDNTIRFSYGQATVGQIIGINNALGSSGLQVHGYTFQYDARTVSENGSGSDPLTSSSFLKDGSGNTLLSTTYQHGVHDWQTFSVSRTLADPYSISGGGTVGVQFSGYDQGYWAGLYGPQVRNVSLRLNYSVGEDPCVTDPLSSTSCPGYAQAYKDQQCSINPLYDTTCPGYAQAYFDQQCSFNPLYDSACPGNSAVITSGNLVPNPGSWYREVNQSYAINTALSHGGAGLQVHAFRWGFQTFGLWGAGDFKSDVNIRDSNGDSIYSFSTGWQNVGGGYTDRSYYYQLPQSRNNLTLGTFEYNTEVTGISAVGNFWARMLYTPDSCSLDPLSSPLCSKYQEAFLAQQCAIYVMYSPQCPGYADALAQMLAEQALLASAATESTTDPVTSVTNTTTNTTSTQPAGTEDPTKNQAAVTTDVGGAELTTTGEVRPADGIPSDVKAAAKESANTEKKEESSTTVTAKSSTTKKPGSRVNALAIAQAAVRDTERTALAAANEAVAASLSDNANPADGIGLGSGLAIPGLRILQGFGNDASSAQADSQAISVTQRRTQEERTEDTQSLAGVEMKKEEKINQNNNPVAIVEQKDDAGKQGPAVRRGGAVDGMSGGDMNALAAMPANFNDYLGKQLQDAQFYASKEIYKGQRNVDNARALRGLGTDRLHQQMVDQQYNITGQ